VSEILIADDERQVAQATAELLQAYGHSVATVNDAPGILAAMRREHPRLVLQDVRMPGLDLDAHLGAIRADPELAGTVVILFTATMSVHELARLLGCDGIVEKPYVPEELMQRVEEWLRRGAGTAPAG
jgi:CheY-like chemotaxis protein